MNYQDLKVIWDQQTEAPLFTIDQDALMASVNEKCAAIEKSLKWNEAILIPGALFCGIALSLQALVTRDPSWISFLVGIIMLIKGVYTWVLCRQRADQERAYEKAVVASIEKAIFQNRHMATLLRRWLFFFHIPAALFAVIGLVFFPAGMTPWMWILFVAIAIYSTWRTPRDLREIYGKEQHELEAIRTRLLEIESRD